MRNTFMSFHWLTQISPSATHGLALVAVAWLFVMRGCVQGNRLQILARDGPAHDPDALLRGLPGQKGLDRTVACRLARLYLVLFRETHEGDHMR